MKIAKTNFDSYVIENTSEVLSGGAQVASSNMVSTTVSVPPVVTPYVRACDCVGTTCGGCALSALCLCALLCNRRCGCRPVQNPCCFTVTAFYGRGCGCRNYSCYYPYYC